MAEGWLLVYDVLILLTAALVCGFVAEKLGQSALLGYLVAGTLVGPGALGAVRDTEVLKVIAEIGVAMLLFTIGLEFSFRRFLRLGKPALVGGLVAIVAVVVLGMATVVPAGIDPKAALAVGCILSLGSTAIVLRVLRDRNELDAGHGRLAVGVSLLQDVALVPLVLGVTLLGGTGEPLPALGRAMAGFVALAAGLLVLVNFIIPRFLDERVVARNREIPIILAITTCLAATGAAHALGLSVALGSFLAGSLLGDNRYADQMRADVTPLRTLFATLFFTTIGTLANAAWIVVNLPLVLGCAGAVMALKTVATHMSLRAFRVPILVSLATALTLSQVGEFSFVLANLGWESGLLDDDLFQLVLSTALVTMLVSPPLIAAAPRLARVLAKRVFSARKLAGSERNAQKAKPLSGHAVLIGYGEAGQAAAARLHEAEMPVLVVELSPILVRLAESHGHRGVLGDATTGAILERAHLETARVGIIAVPDMNVSRILVSQCKSFAPRVPLAVRARYHVFRDDLDVIGSDAVVDEENSVGKLLGEAALGLNPPHKDPEPLKLDESHSLR